MSSVRPAIRSHLSRAWNDPLSRNAYSLVVASSLSSAVGMLFWVAAARLYAVDDVGLAGSLVSATILIANIATLGLRNGLVRFLPQAGRGAGRLIRNCYLTCAAVAVGLASLSWAGHIFLPADLHTGGSGVWGLGLFALAVVAFVLSMLQDNALTGLRQSQWLPVVHSTAAVGKLAVLLVVGVVGGTAWGILAAWALPALAVLAVVTLLMFRRVPGAAGTTAGTPGVSLAGLTRFAAGEHVALLFGLASTNLLPLVVLAHSGPAASGYVFLAMMIAESTTLVTSGIAAAFLAEASLAPQRWQELAWRAMRQSARLIVPVALIGALVAPLPLRLLGPDYAGNAATLLRLLLVGSVLSVPMSIGIDVARLQQRVGLVVAAHGAHAAIVVGGTYLALDGLGIEAVGVAWLAAQLTVGTTIAATTLRSTWIDHLAARLVRARATARRRLQAAQRLHLTRRISPHLGQVLGEVAARPEVVRSHNDAVVLRSDTGELGPVIIKVADSEAAIAALDRHSSVLEQLSESLPPAGCRALLPRVLQRGSHGSARYLIETMLPGDPLDRVVREHPAAVCTGIQAVASLHRVTARSDELDTALIAGLVDEPADLLAGAVADLSLSDELADLRRSLRTALLFTEATTSTTLGNCWPGNLLCRSDAAGPVITGITDWEQGSLRGLPDVDLAHYWLAQHPEGIAAAVVDGLRDPAQSLDDRLAPWGVRCPNPHLGAPAVLCLAWLAHVSAGIQRASRFALGDVWFATTVRPVLAALRDDPMLLDAIVTPPAPRDAAPALRLVPDDAVVAGPAIPLAHTRSSSPAVEGPAAPAVDAGDQPSAGRRPRPAVPWSTSRHPGLVWLIAPLVGVALWVIGFWGADPQDMTGRGLVSLLSPVAAAGLATIAGGFVVALWRRASERVLALHIIAFLALVHGTPAVLYGTVRYAWSWKHLGIVDYITRHGAVDTTIDVLDVYHNWPGFFSANALVVDLAGSGDARTLALWAPLAFNLWNLLGLRFVLRRFDADVTTVWLAIWLFFITNWVGQDYFSPQAMGFALYLPLLGVLLHAFGRDRPLGRTNRWAIGAFAVLALTISSSHQVTPYMMVAATSSLALLRRLRGPLAPLIAVGSMVAWMLLVARGYTVTNIVDVIEAFGKPVANAEQTFELSANVRPEQQLVVRSGRLVVVLLGVLAAMGTVHSWRNRRLKLVVLNLAAVPATLVVVTEFGGEAIFRVFLFAAPFLGLLAARAIVPSGAGRRMRLWPGLAVTAIALPLFLLAYYGKERQNHFTPDEVAAATVVYGLHPSGDELPPTLLIEGTRNYPSLFRNYEQFLTVAISREPLDSWQRVVTDPATELHRWLDDPSYAGSYLILTRSQKIEVEDLGALPSGSLDDIEQALRTSPAFRVVYENRDAVIFALREDGR